MSNINPLHPITPIGGNQQNINQQPSTNEPRTPVQAKVTATLGNNQFMVTIGGNEVKIHTSKPLVVGQNIQLKLPQMGQQGQEQILVAPRTTTNIETTAAANTELKAKIEVPQSPMADVMAGIKLLSSGIFFSAKPIDLSTLFTHLFSGANMGQGLSQSARNTLSLFISSQESFIHSDKKGSILQSLISLLGLSHEKNIRKNVSQQANLKNSLLEIAHKTKGDSTISDEANQQLARLVFSQLSFLQGGYNGDLIMPLPLPFLEKGFLHIPPKKKDSDGDQLNCSLYISLSELGNMHIHITGDQRKGIFLRIKTENDGVQNYIHSHENILKKNLGRFIPVRGTRIETGATDISTKLLSLAIANKGENSAQLLKTTA